MYTHFELHSNAVKHITLQIYFVIIISCKYLLTRPLNRLGFVCATEPYSYYIKHHWQLQGLLMLLSFMLHTKQDSVWETSGVILHSVVSRLYLNHFHCKFPTNVVALIEVSRNKYLRFVLSELFHPKLSNIKLQKIKIHMPTN